MIPTGIPPDIRDITGRDSNSTEMYFCGAMTLVSYVCKKRSGNKHVMAVGTMPPLFGVTKDDEYKKPAPLKLYDKTKGIKEL